uniref:Hermansky-Pudlak syndrome 1 protein n=1 Tax=Petromyzon marinus TaxID=7757 RepID=A0AAJ7U3T8_PETMA|nr:Hermansky-Pudlak syndrome 1 protein [Petromyzon marinus]
MKCLLIADSSADVKFVWADAAFAARLHRAAGGVDASPEQEVPAALDMDSLVYRMFAPLVASATVLETELEDSYASFECLGDGRYALRRFGDLLYVAVSACAAPHGAETDLARDIFALRRLVEFRFGLACHDSELLRKALKPPGLEKRRRVWAELDATLSALARLRDTEQGFLVEAVERIASPQLAEGCLERLEKVVIAANAVPEREREGEEVVHAFILVHTKLLAFYSARNAGVLAPSDLLLLILVAQKMFPRREEGNGAASEGASTPTAAADKNENGRKAEPRATLGNFGGGKGRQQPPGRRPGGRAPGNGGDAETGRCPGKAEFEFVRSEAVNPRSQSPSRFSQNTSSEEDFQMALESVADETVLAELTEGGCRSGGSSTLAASSVPFVFGLEAQRVAVSVGAGHCEDDNDDDKLPKRVFLETGGRESYSPFTPHNLYCYEVHPGITLSLLSRGPSSRLAAPMSSLLDYFVSVEKIFDEGIRPRLKDDMDRKMKQIVDCQKIGRSQTTSLQEVWQLFKRKLLVKSSETLDVDCLTSACRTIQKFLCKAFSVLYLLDTPSARMYRSLEEIALQSMRKKLEDYKDFLLVKSARNITMAAYLEKFPGLVHFLYMDRALGLLVAPALLTEGGSELGHGAIAAVVRDLVWWFVSFARRMLRHGYNSIALRKGDFVCSYFLWFRDTGGKSLAAPDLKADVEEGPAGQPVGVLAGDSYRRLMWLSARRRQEEVRCYEMVALHLAVVPAECIAQQCQQLVKTLWEPPGLPLL